jgi:hypothetical protein
MGIQEIGASNRAGRGAGSFESDTIIVVGIGAHLEVIEEQSLNHRGTPVVIVHRRRVSEAMPVSDKVSDPLRGIDALRLAPSVPPGIEDCNNPEASVVGAYRDLLVGFGLVNRPALEIVDIESSEFTDHRDNGIDRGAFEFL